MLKRKSLRKLNRSTDERKRLFRQLIKTMADKGKLVTSLAKAKAVKPQLEKLVTHAKNNSLVNLRRLIAETGDMTTAQNLLKAGEVFKSRPGGYTRIVRLGHQFGDNSEQVRLEWVENVVISRPVVEKEGKKSEKAVKVDKTKEKVEKTKETKKQRKKGLKI